MKTKYSVEIANTISEFLKKDDWKYSFDAENGIYRMGVGLECDLNHIDIRIRVYDDSFSVNAVSPIKVKKDPAKRKEMAEFICRANYGLMCGGFQYDIRDGEILYKVFVPCYDINPSQEMIRRSLYIPAMMFDKYSEGMLAILFGDVSAKDAVNSCEEPSGERAEILKTLEGAAESGDIDIDGMLARLSERFDSSDDGSEEDSGSTGVERSTEDRKLISVNPFSGEGDDN